MGEEEEEGSGGGYYYEEEEGLELTVVPEEVERSVHGE